MILPLELFGIVQNTLGRLEIRKIISRKRHYSSVTIVAGSLIGLPYSQDGFGFCPPFIVEKRLIHKMFDIIDSVLSRIKFRNL